MASFDFLPSHWLVCGRPSISGPTVIFDIDGVLSDAADRLHYFEPGLRQNWDEFFASCGDDPLIAEVAALLSYLDKDLNTVLLTARPVAVQEQTIAWLKNFALRCDLLIMRNYGDHTAAQEFKSETVDELRAKKIEPVLAFEDDQRNVDMFRSKGIPCVYIHSGYYEARKGI